MRINGATHDLWRAVDQQGAVLDILVQSRRNKRAAKKFFRKLLKGLAYVPRVLITDKLASYGAAQRDVLPSVEPRQHLCWPKSPSRAEPWPWSAARASEARRMSNRPAQLAHDVRWIGK